MTGNPSVQSGSIDNASPGASPVRWGVFSCEASPCARWVLEVRTGDRQRADEEGARLAAKHPKTPEGVPLRWRVEELAEDGYSVARVVRPRPAKVIPAAAVELPANPAPAPPLPAGAVVAPAAVRNPPKRVRPTKTKVCGYCGSEFPATHPRALYCPGKGCRQAAHRRDGIGEGTRLGLRSCRWCRGLFPPKHPKQVFCRATHREKYHNTRANRRG